MTLGASNTCVFCTKVFRSLEFLRRSYPRNIKRNKRRFLRKSSNSKTRWEEQEYICPLSYGLKYVTLGASISCIFCTKGYRFLAFLRRSYPKNINVTKSDSLKSLGTRRRVLRKEQEYTCSLSYGLKYVTLGASNTCIFVQNQTDV